MRESIIGPWHFGHAGVSIATDEMRKCWDWDAGMMLAQTGGSAKLSVTDDAEDEPVMETTMLSWVLNLVVNIDHIQKIGECHPLVQTGWGNRPSWAGRNPKLPDGVYLAKQEAANEQR